MIQKAQEKHVPRLLRYGRLFFTESGYGEYVRFDEDRLRGVFAEMIESPHAAVFIANGGLAGATLTQMYFTSDVTAHELFWWVEPDKRGSYLGDDLREALEDWARDNGASVLTTSTLDAATPEHVERKFKAAGYRPAERGFIRRL